MAEEYVSCSVFVAVRARPFNSREKALKASTCLQFYSGGSVQISAPGPGGKKTSAPAGDKKSFAFDKAYDMKTAQETVFLDMGMPVVAATMEGYNACIFAYGQTGSGKSFSMLGPSDAAHILPPSQSGNGGDSDGEGGAPESPEPVSNAAFYEMRGLIPRILEEVFKESRQLMEQNRIDLEAARESREAAPPRLEIQVTVSYTEIYNEKARCLFAPEKGGDLRVRNHPETGAYVENLTIKPVTNAQEALVWLSKGNSARIVGSTNMNDTSSRSHAIFSFQVKQIRTLETEEGPNTTELTSSVNLVDLAGSERAKSTGAEGDRLKEGAGINKSLTVLGLVISGLADASKAAAAPRGRAARRAAASSRTVTRSSRGCSRRTWAATARRSCSPRSRPPT
jgi:kinesin family protein 1